DLDCAHCAAKIEDSVRKIEGVAGAEVNFLNQKMVLEADQERFQEIAEKAVTLIRKIEPDVTVKKI
ncbi:MAG: cation transporter, partial [Blautia sp.]|nr:cation transporter [Blautia sp.]